MRKSLVLVLLATVVVGCGEAVVGDDDFGIDDFADGVAVESCRIIDLLNDGACGVPVCVDYVHPLAASPTCHELERSEVRTNLEHCGFASGWSDYEALAGRCLEVLRGLDCSDFTTVDLNPGGETCVYGYWGDALNDAAESDFNVTCGVFACD